MKTTVIWTFWNDCQTVLRIHHHTDTPAGRYAVSRLWPDQSPGGWHWLALWPVSASYAGDLPVMRVDADGAPVLECEYWARLAAAVKARAVEKRGAVDVAALARELAA